MTTPKPAVTTTPAAEPKTATYAGQSLGTHSTQTSTRPSFLGGQTTETAPAAKPAYTAPVTPAQQTP